MTDTATADRPETPHPGDDLSYYLGPAAVCATQEQCDELARMFEQARAETT